MDRVKKANLFLLITVCVYLGGSYLLAFIGGKVELPYELLVLSGQIFIGASLIGYIIISRGEALKMIKHERLGFVDIILIVVTMFLFLPLVYFINAISLTFTENAVAGTMMEIIDNSYLINLLMIAVTPAVVEELVCRGVLFHSYKTKNVLFAVIMSAFIFGLLHMNINQMLYAMVLGFIFAIMVEATGSIYSSMIMHFITNSISVTMIALLNLFIDMGLYSEEMLEEIFSNQQQVQEAVVATSGAVDVILFMIGFLVVVATTSCAVLLITYIAKRRGHSEELKAIFKRTKKEDDEPGTSDSFVKEYGLLIAAIVICLFFMIVL